MTISSTNRKAGPYTGNGTATVFPFAFKVFQASDLDVVRLDTTLNVETNLTLTTDYTVALNGDQDSNPGGSLTLVAGALASGFTLTITSDIANLQPTDLTNQGGFYPDVINDALDRATIQIQQLQEQVNRSLKVAISSTADVTLPPPAANDLIGWDATGTNLANIDPATLATVVAYATAYADVFLGDGVTQSWLLTRNPGSLYNLDVSINGSSQEPVRDYTFAGTTFTMTTPPPINSRVLVKYKEGLPNYSGDSQDIRYLPAGTGAVAETVQAKLREYVSVKDFGAKGDGSTDDTAAIQAAIDTGYPLHFPAGTYMLSLGTSITLEGGATVCSLKAKTGMVLKGDGWGKSILKLKDNQSTDASPKYFNIIATNEHLDSVVIDGLCFDINGANNKISPNRGGLVYNKFNCAAFMCSGSIATVGHDAYLTNFQFTNCMVKNSPGVTCIGLAQSNQTGTALGDNIEIAHNVFQNNGLDTDDHSSIYMWANNVKVHHNYFSNSTMSSGIQGPLAAAELHGSYNWFTDNNVVNYLWGVYVAGNLTNVSRGQYVHDNYFFVAQKAVAMFNETASEPGMADISLVGNKVWLTDEYHHPGGQAKKAFDLVPSQGAVDGLVVSENIILTSDLYGAYAIRVGALASGKSIRNIRINDNITKGFGTCISVGVAGGGYVDNCAVENNSLLDIKPNTTAPTITIGIYVEGGNGAISINNNRMKGVVAANPYYGVYLAAGSIDSLDMDRNVAANNTTAVVVDAVTVGGKRKGRQALTFAALPAQSTWVQGDYAYNASAGQLGSAGSKYIITQWHRATSGTGNVLNTDWFECRSLTGN